MSSDAQSTTSNDWSERFSETLVAARARSRDFLQAQQERLDHLEEEIRQQVAELDEVRQENDTSEARSDTLAQRLSELDGQTARLLDHRSLLLTQQEVMLTSREQAFADHEARAAILTERATELTTLEEQVARTKEESEHAEAEWHALREQLQTEQGERQRIDEQLQHQQQSADTAAAEMAQTLERLRQERDEQNAKLVELETHAGDASQASDDLKQLRQERDALRTQLTAAESRASESHSSSDPSAAAQIDELNRRFETAVEDARKLKQCNAEMEEELLAQRSRGPTASEAPSQHFDWESQKKRLIASLDGGDDSQAAAEERTTVEGTVQITDQIIAEKDRELRALRDQLANQSAAPAIDGAAAADAAQVLDQDDMIQQERDKLRQMQEEQLEKQRKAEIELAVERAKVARERASVDEQIAEHKLRDKAAAEGKETSDEGGEAPRGRWLSRLGLQDLDD